MYLARVAELDRGAENKLTMLPSTGKPWRMCVMSSMQQASVINRTSIHCDV
jgi:hypothetical protein